MQNKEAAFDNRINHISQKGTKSYFAELRRAFKVADITQAEIAEAINRSAMYLSNCLNRKGKASFTLDEAYTILDLIHADHEDFYMYFPQHGVFLPERKREKKRPEGVLISFETAKILKTIFTDLEQQ